MSANELRQAAETLRERADDATSAVGPGSMQAGWASRHDTYAGESTIESGDFAIGQAYTMQAGDYIATMHPGVGLALADWLDEAAGLADALDEDPFFVKPEGLVRMRDNALTLAGLINGGAA